MPHSAAGMRIDPPVSEPMAAGHRPPATATAEPLDEPPATRWVVAVPRIPRRAHRLVASPAAEREFDHVRLAERDHSGGREAFDRRRRVIGDPAEPALRAGGGLPAFDVEEVLQRDRQPCERTGRGPGPALPVGRVGRRERVVAIDLDERVQMGIERVDARETRLDDRARARLAALEQARECGQRLERKVVGHGVRRGRTGCGGIHPGASGASRHDLYFAFCRKNCGSGPFPGRRS